jgi:hypothetical protein
MYMKFSNDTHHRNTYVLCVEYRLQVNNYKPFDVVSFWDYIQQI